MKNKIKYIAILIIIISFVYINPIKVHSNIENINVKENKIMIVAHPDDEMLWGGAHLIKDDYLVVCITCGSNHKRLNEFKKVMKETNDDYITLGYPDKTLKRRSNWKHSYNHIYSELERILLSKDWDVIVTYDKNGVYGHKHHKMTYKMVTDIYKSNHLKGKLYYYGKYYTKKKLPEVEENLEKLPQDVLTKKEEILKLYKSQKRVREMFSHMMPYETWVEYK